jgi:hypothetical protein
VTRLLGTISWLFWSAIAWARSGGPRHEFNATLIDPALKLYMGGGYANPLPPEFDAVVSLALESPVTAPMGTLTAPILDDANMAPPIGWLANAVSWVEWCQMQRWSTLCHCAEGVSRSGLVTVACVMKARGWGRDKALAYVKSKRDVCEPNPAFMKLLAEWESNQK